MISILGIEIHLPPQFTFLAAPLPAFFLNPGAWFIVAAIIFWVIIPFIKRFTRSLPGEVEDIILGIIRRPLSMLVFMIGLRLSIPHLQAGEEWERFLTRFSMTLIILLAGHIIGRIIRDVLVYYGETWARRTESQVDDILLPVLSLFGPLALIIIAGLIILPMWGVDISSVLLGAGVLGLVLGLALQETLSNIFSGLSLLIEAPFRRGDLIRLTSGKVCEVQRLGLRSTMLLSLDEQSTIYMPNKILASDSLTNLTKPTAEQRYSITVGVGTSNDLTVVQDLLFQIAAGHPGVLASDIKEKIPRIRAQVARLRDYAGSLSTRDPVHSGFEEIAAGYENAIKRLSQEEKVNRNLLSLEEEIREMIRGIRSREKGGMTRQELLEIKNTYITPVEERVRKTTSLVEKWVSTRDRWVREDDYWAQKQLWGGRNEALLQRWENLKKCIQHPDESMELRLDDLSGEMIDWLNHEYKVVPGVWKNPMVEITSVSADTIQLELHYYVDNIRLEMDGRPRRVRSELNQLIRHTFLQEGIWS